MPGRQTLDTHDIGQETDQLECPRGECIGTRPQIGIIIEQMRQVMLQHAAARTRRHHHVVIAAERIENASAKVARSGPITGIVGGLAAAGLRTRHFDLAAGLFQQPYRRKANRRTIADRPGR